jgi:hypothetical protein
MNPIIPDKYNKLMAEAEYWEKRDSGYAESLRKYAEEIIDSLIKRI